MKLSIGDTIPATYNNEVAFKEHVQPHIDEAMFQADLNDCALLVIATSKRSLRIDGSSVLERNNQYMRVTNGAMLSSTYGTIFGLLALLNKQGTMSPSLDEMIEALKVAYAVSETAAAQIAKSKAKFG